MTGRQTDAGRAPAPDVTGPELTINRIYTPDMLMRVLVEDNRRALSFADMLLNMLPSRRRDVGECLWTARDLYPAGGIVNQASIFLG